MRRRYARRRCSTGVVDCITYEWSSSGPRRPGRVRRVVTDGGMERGMTGVLCRAVAGNRTDPYYQ
jgi:hypothetical protein